MAAKRPYKSILGRVFGVGSSGQMVVNGINASSECADAVITVGAEAANARAITIQLKDAYGEDLASVVEVELVLFLTADRLAYVVTGGSTGIAIGTDGALSTVVAKKRFYATCEADGDIDLTWTDTGTEAAYLGLKLPSGRWVMSDALTNA